MEESPFSSASSGSRPESNLEAAASRAAVANPFTLARSYPFRGMYNDNPVAPAPIAISPWPRLFRDTVDGCDEEDYYRNFLDECFLCKKPLAGNGDIFMYRGDVPFCSEECRQEQMEMDEEREKKRKKVAMRASSTKELQEEQAVVSPKSRKVQAGSVLAG